MIRSIIEHKRVTPEPNSGCWLWTGATHSGGYGNLRKSGKTWLAHRYSWFLETGQTPDCMVLHKCNNRACCNPEHLYLGTAKDNTQYAIQCGRIADGDRSPQSKLSSTQVRAIRAAHAAGVSCYRLARDHGMSDETIRKIVLRATWKRLDA